MGAGSGTIGLRIVLRVAQRGPPIWIVSPQVRDRPYHEREDEENPTAIRGFVRNPSTTDTAITAALANTNRFASVSDRMGILMRADSPTV